MRIEVGLILLELNDGQKGALNAMLESGSLHLYKLTDDQVFALAGMNFPAGLSDSDKSVLWYVQKISESAPVILSGDKLLRNWCEKKGFEVHGILWIFDQMLLSQLTTPSKAYKKLQVLMRSNQWLPKEECWDRLEKWVKEE